MRISKPKNKQNNMEQFDHFYRQRLSEHETPVPSDMFDRIQQRRKKKTFFAFGNAKNIITSLLGAVLIGLTTVGYFSNTTVGENKTVANHTSSSVHHQGIPKSIDGRFTTKENGATANETQHATTYKKEVKNILNTSKSNTYAYKNIFSKEKINTDVVENIDHKNTPPIINVVEDFTTKSLVNSAVTNIAYVENNVNHSDNDMAITLLYNNIPLVQSLNATSAHLPTIVTKKHGDDCPTFKRKRTFYYFGEIFTSPQYAKRALTLSDRADQENYLALRDSVENPYWAFDAGLHLGIHHKSGFSLKTGVLYQQINEIFEYKIADYELKIYNPDGTLKGTQLGERYAKTYNRYRFVSVPLLIGYEFRTPRKGQKWSFGAHAGASLNIFTHYKGSIIPSNDFKTLATFTNGKASIEPFKNNIGVMLHADVTVYRKLSDRTKLFIAPKYTKIMKPITVENYPLQQRYDIFGITVGLHQAF
jgi:hypothetical protein